ncbi:RNA 3'-terminal phosphate cyclase [Methanothermobacter sp. DP]|uniref:RNA 3'-terminal phosphate cyclase n=1 Tax=unclassified Methanothermobacter TaxID=2631116 RepID=UPI002AA5C965|nr:RNA 3'-terminal phosphate cyclase [Methanothermobacter sp. DP]
MDGSEGEGGGAVVRVSTALVALESCRIRIYNIRARRPRKGLSHQHLTAVRAIAEISNGRLRGDELGSMELEFSPGRVEGGKFEFDIKTAGSTGLVLQAIMIASTASRGELDLTVRGGTDVLWAPTADYLREVTLPILGMMGYTAKLELIERGYYPEGGGVVNATIEPSTLRPLVLEGAEIHCIRGVSHSRNLPIHVAERQAESARKILERTGLDVDIRVEDASGSLGRGSGITLWAEGNTRLGATSLGKPGKRAELVGAEAAEELLGFIESGRALDRYMGDQIIPYMAIAGNSRVSTCELTLHAETNIMLAEKITGRKFRVDGERGGPAIIEAL